MTDVREENKSRLAVDVYVAALPEGDVCYPVLPEERETELRGVSSDLVRREKYHAWRLLEYALRESLGLSMEEARPYRSPSGKWLSARAEFSISHSGGIIAVAVSREHIGLDVERCGRELPRGFAARMLTERELASLDGGSDGVTEVWCRKEAIFKMRGESRFIPREVESTDVPLYTERLSLPEGEYILALAAPSAASVTVKLCGAEAFL